MIIYCCFHQRKPKSVNLWEELLRPEIRMLPSFQHSLHLEDNGGSLQYTVIPTFRMSGAVPLLPYTIMACEETTLHLLYPIG